MIRKIVQIDEARCSGCGLCARACREEAIVIENGKARLIRDDYCDGLGNCLPACPMDAIAIIEREAAAFDEAAVKINMAAKPRRQMTAPASGGCAGSRVQLLNKADVPVEDLHAAPSMLRQWPVQIRLASVAASYFDDAHLLVAADCTAYACGSFHQDFIRGRVTLIGCPKLDEADYADKLAEILTAHSVRSVTVARMEVPCCGGIVRAVTEAIRRSGKAIPCRVATISPDGRIIQ